MPDLVRDERAGQSFKVGNIEALAIAIQTVLAEPPEPKEIEAVAEAHSVASARDGILQAIEKLAIGCNEAHA